MSVRALEVQASPNWSKFHKAWKRLKTCFYHEQNCRSVSLNILWISAQLRVPNTKKWRDTFSLIRVIEWMGTDPGFPYHTTRKKISIPHQRHFIHLTAAPLTMSANWNTTGSFPRGIHIAILICTYDTKGEVTSRFWWKLYDEKRRSQHFKMEDFWSARGIRLLVLEPVSMRKWSWV